MDFGNYGVVFLAASFENLIVVVDPDVRDVGRDGENVEFVDVVEFRSFGFGGSGHASQFLIEAEVVLDGDGGVGLSFLFDFHSFFGFHGLVETI